jgi:hypothetical protein
MMKMVKNFRIVGKREEEWGRGGGVVRGEVEEVGGGKGRGGGGKAFYVSALPSKLLCPTGL